MKNKISQEFRLCSLLLLFYLQHGFDFCSMPPYNAAATNSTATTASTSIAFPSTSSSLFSNSYNYSNNNITNSNNSSNNRTGGSSSGNNAGLAVPAKSTKMENLVKNIKLRQNMRFILPPPNLKTATTMTNLASMGCNQSVAGFGNNWSCLNAVNYPQIKIIF